MSERSRGGRLTGILAALRFARIPVICAVLVASLTTAPVARAVEIGVAVLVLGMAMALHGREILYGRAGAEPARDDAASREHWRGGSKAA